ncbi:prealbumin-like fold domain-containing protein [Mycetocola reblochoni]|nr:prealbumin-like fold domain-containing protein [Mycetocola reblochoni]
MRVHTRSVPASARSTMVGALASVLALALVVIGIAGATPSLAATPGVTVTGSLVDDAVVNEGSTQTLKLQYSNSGSDRVEPGSTVDIVLSDNVSIDPATLEVTNEGIASIEQIGNTLRVTFANPMPTTTQGVVELRYTVNTVEKSSKEPISWSVGGETTSVDVTIKNDGDEIANVSDGSGKQTRNGWLGNFVSVADGVVTVADSLIGSPIGYELHLDSKNARSDYPISDTLPEGLSYVADSLSAEITTWDADGLNKSTQPFDVDADLSGSSFATTVNVDGPSRLVLRYSATVADEAARQALQDRLQAEYDTLGEDGGRFGLDLVNTADFGGESKTATVWIGGDVAGPSKPNLGGAFGKSASWGQRTVTAAEDGTLDPAVPISYTLTATLSDWDGSNAYRTLDRNVVISDELVPQLRWADGERVTVSPAGALTPVEFDGTADEFAADEFVGHYAIVGSHFLANLGTDSATSVSITLNAEATSITGLSTGWTNVSDATGYVLPNSATFSYDDDANPERRSADATLVDGDFSNGVHDDSKFSKKAPAGLTASPGEALSIPYTFTIDASEVDLTSSTIVDHVDPAVFDLSDAAIATAAKGATGLYAWWKPLDSGDLDVALTDDGAITVALSEAGVATIAPAISGRLQITLPLTTKPIVGKQTLSVSNSATLIGSDEKALYWSETSTSATSFGDEAETRKSIRDSGDHSWKQSLRAEFDPASGELVQDVYVYDLAFIPHGKYKDVRIIPTLDTMPAGVEFLGFVGADDVDTAERPTTDTVKLDGNLQASYDADSTTVTVENRPGTLLNTTDPVHVYVAVRIVDYTADTPIVNTFGNSQATLVPSNDFPLTIRKVDADDTETVISDPEARFQIQRGDGTVVVDDVFVEDGFLRVTGPDGSPVGVTVTEPGSYEVVEKRAPAGYALSDERVRVTVGEDGRSDVATFLNTRSDEPTPTETPVTPEPTPTETPVTPEPTPTDTPVTPEPTTPATDEPTAGPSGEPSEPASTTSTAPVPDQPAPSTSADADGSDDLARTGASGTGIIALAGALLLAAAALFGLRARRRS